MSNTGFIYAGSCSSGGGVGTESWTDASKAAGSPNADPASVLLLSGSTSHYLVGSFSHGLSAGDTIDGIEAAINRSATNSSPSPPHDYSVRLVVNGSVSGSDKAVEDPWPEDPDWSNVYGGPTDTWGLSLSGADSIGLAVSAVGFEFFDSAYVDSMEIKIYYTPGGGGGGPGGPNVIYCRSFFLLMK